MTWVLVLVVCSALADPSTCEDRVVAHRLSEAECHALARPLSARGEIAECLPEEHDVIEEPDEEDARLKGESSNRRRAMPVIWPPVSQPDRERIDVTESVALRGWALRLGCSEGQVIAAVMAVGARVVDVKRHLYKL